MEQHDEALGDDVLDAIGTAVRSVLPDHKHFIVLVLGEGPTKLEVVSDVQKPEAILSILEWGKRVIDGTEGPNDVY